MAAITCNKIQIAECQHDISTLIAMHAFKLPLYVLLVSVEQLDRLASESHNIPKQTCDELKRIHYLGSRYVSSSMFLFKSCIL